MAIEGLERLGYHNGQRLEATDLRLEQRYHIDVRRLLNRGLFTPGVVSGLEVEKIVRTVGTVEGRKLRVRLGVAIDPLGREIVLREDVEVDVPNQPATTGIGYFLTARYSEQLVPGGDPWCGGPNGAPTPARVREEPVLEWSEDVPAHRRCRKGDEGIDCGVLLALVVLDASCEVDHVQTGVREYARPTHVSQVQAFSFEGEKDIDLANPKQLNFRIRGGAPASVALYLWGGQFSSLFYTELGRHTHTFNQPTGSATTRLAAHTHTLAHTHTIPAATTSSDGAHGHSLRVDTAGVSFDPNPLVFPRNGREGTVSTHQPAFRGSEYAPRGGIGQDYVESVAGHDHSVAVGPTDAPSVTTTGPASPTTGTGAEDHYHYVPESVFAGVDDLDARSGPNHKAHTYLDDLRVALDGQDITQLILDRYVPQSWGTLGNGQPNHPFNDDEGTGPIDLLELAAEIGVDLGAESHRLTFSVQDGGGKVLYNLYVA